MSATVLGKHRLGRVYDSCGMACPLNKAFSLWSLIKCIGMPLKRPLLFYMMTIYTRNMATKRNSLIVTHAWHGNDIPIIKLLVCSLLLCLVSFPAELVCAHGHQSQY